MRFALFLPVLLVGCPPPPSEPRDPVRGYCDEMTRCFGNPVFDGDCVSVENARRANALELLGNRAPDECDETAQAHKNLLECVDARALEGPLDCTSFPCPFELGKLNEQLDKGGIACLRDGASERASTPADFKCLGRHFDTEDGCDCGCGFADTDCAVDEGCIEEGCAVVGCDFCYEDAEDAENGVVTECEEDAP